ncbi:fatty acid conjugase [Stereum hirsutum FP-91666 SS1]|uniref:fatty acid conjugase n=1 Tax=Stereum hirsutum (strain FP-91666) TaxID=721885 RepID=UPI000444A3E0|nr:fatty acid conjugase [Stereum hirsutum FP-91666 SS1]EIM82560.1 fatty acid conjugase [Stereum hirsutum FP-91666 SS1]
MIFNDSPEYLERKNTPFTPPDVGLSQIHAAIPQAVYRKSTWKGLYYVSCHLVLVWLLYSLAVHIDDVPSRLARIEHRVGVLFIRCALWAAYWLFQGIALAGWWTLAHEAGHGNLSQYKIVNNIVGFTLHSMILTPYFAWRSTHRAHHKAAGSMERDENFVPRTRSDYGLPKDQERIVYSDFFEDAPLYTIISLLLMQLGGLQAYLLFNSMGLPSYPPGTNHFYPSSALFKSAEYSSIVISDAGIAVILIFLFRYAMHHGFTALGKYYIVPYILANHWVVLFVFLQHSDPTVPHYRGDQWTFLRGALATVDRPVMGRFGRFFFHNLSHDHVAHHLFSTVPFYNLPEVTRVLRSILKEHHNYDSTNTFYALYRSFTQCWFVEDEGGIVFYKDRRGHSQRELTFIGSSQSGTPTGVGNSKSTNT